MNKDDLYFPVEIRGLKPGNTTLSWPMQGYLEVNQGPYRLFHEFVPLKHNSNRKNRREQYVTIPKDLLKLGKNVLKFIIPTLDE